MGIHDLISVAYWKCWGLLPISRKKILFSSYYGRGFSDSPKAIAQELLRRRSDLDLCWLVKNQQEADTLPPGIRPVFMDGRHRVREMATARIWVDNCRKYERFKRKGQFYLQTWHGFTLKRLEADAIGDLDPAYVAGAKRDAAQTDLMVTGSAFMKDIYTRSFWYDGPVEPWGTPRNDCFFREDAQLNDRIRDFFGLSRQTRLLLYAPTFRSDHSTACYGLDARAALRACEQRFGGSWAALIRLHPNVAHQSADLFSYDGSTVLDATGYPDMQELLCGCDLLITDYSSSMFDFALRGKPCIRFALDVEAYRRDRNFYFELEALPFPMAENNEALCDQIAAFDAQAQAERWAQFQAENGFCEDGNAASRCADWILSKL